MVAIWLVLGIEARLDGARLVVALTPRLRRFSSAVGSVRRSDVGGAEVVQPVLRAVGDHEVLAFEHAVVLRRQVGDEFEHSGRFGDQGFYFACRRDASSFRAIRCAVRGSPSSDAREGQRFGGYHGVAVGGDLLEHGFVALRFEREFHVVAPSHLFPRRPWWRSRQALLFGNRPSAPRRRR